MPVYVLPLHAERHEIRNETNEMNYTIINCDQGTDEWLKARKGKITASQADDILTPTGKLSTSCDGLIRRLSRECILDDPMAFAGNAATQWGHDNEPRARELFTELTGYAVDQVGFLQSSLHPALGCSPDGLMIVDGEIRGLEIKCPSVDTHVDYVMGGVIPAKYKPQVHFSMAITGIRKWYFMSYYPGLNPIIVLVERDDYTDKMRAAALEVAANYQQQRTEIINKLLPRL
jgi:exodeoxyribonuclease (lambda-induced)